MKNIILVSLLLSSLLLFCSARHRQNETTADNVKAIANQISALTAEHVMQFTSDFFNNASLALKNPKIQQNITDILRKARNLAALIDVNSVRVALLETVDDVFAIIERLRTNIVNGLTEVSKASGFFNDKPIDKLKGLVQNLGMTLFFEYNTLNQTIQSRIAKIENAHLARLKTADRETLRLVSSLIGTAAGNLYSVLSKLEQGTKVLSFQFNLFNIDLTNAFEKRVKEVAKNLANDLKAYNISHFRGITREGLEYVFSQISYLKESGIALADKALASAKPGDVLSERLLEIKATFGSRVIDFRNKLVATWKRIVRDTVAAVNLRKFSALNPEEALRSAYADINARVNEIADIFKNLYA